MINIDNLIKEAIKSKDKKLTGNYIKLLKNKFPTADCKVIADIVKEVLNS